MAKVPVNFRIDSELLARAKAQAEQQGISLIALLERSLRAELEVSSSTASVDQPDVKTIVETAVNTVKTDIEQVKVNITDVETFVKTITESVNTIRAEVAGLSQQLNTVSTTVDTIVNTKAVDIIDQPIVNTDVKTKENPPNLDLNWVNLEAIAAMLQVKPKSIADAASKRGRDIGDDTIEFQISGRTIQKQGKGIKARYQLVLLN